MQRLTFYSLDYYPTHEVTFIYSRRKHIMNVVHVVIIYSTFTVPHNSN